MSTRPIRIAISSCLLGEQVRYDGQHKFNAEVEQLCQHNIEFISICPEVGIGLSVPRPAVHVISFDEGLKVVGVKDASLDITGQLTRYAGYILETHKEICGYIFKSRSPSCGVSDTLVFSLQDKQTIKGSGLVAKYIIEHAQFPVVDENCLSTPECRAKFLEAVTLYHKNKELNVK